MSKGAIIAGMWGTTTLRAFLLRDGSDRVPGRVIEAREGPGASRLAADDFESVLFDLAGDWLRDHEDAPVILAGMVGSTIGWRDTGYVACPTALGASVMRERFVARGREISIIKGLSCRNVFGEPDVMRGEETEILGWLGLCEEARHGERLICVPGTHAKWVRLRDGVVFDFLTSVAGEQYAALKANGVLIPKNAAAHEVPTDAFHDGVRSSLASNASLIHQLFSVRARRVSGVDDDAAGADRLSGLIIGADVAGALQAFGVHPAQAPIVVIGAPAVAKRYCAALDVAGMEGEMIDAEDACAAGFWSARAGGDRNE